MKQPWWHVLKVAPDAPMIVREAAYRALARTVHPDLGGDSERMCDLNAAIAQARAACERRSAPAGVPSRMLSRSNVETATTALVYIAHGARRPIQPVTFGQLVAIVAEAMEEDGPEQVIEELARIAVDLWG